MATIREFLSNDPRSCDHLLSEAENQVSSGDWGRVAEALGRLNAGIQDHLRMEEDVLFPAIEDRAGSGFGPIAVMKSEHVQMRELLEELENAAKARDSEAFL